VQTAVYDRSGTLVVTASWDRSARVWDSMTGDPLTPALWHLRALSRASFLSDGRHILTTDNAGISWIWDPPSDQRPLADILRTSQVVSGRNSRESVNTQPEILPQKWRQLHSAYPALFGTTKEERMNWHRFQADACESEEQWFGAAFHLRWLLSYVPADSSISNRLASVRLRQRASP